MDQRLIPEIHRAFPNIRMLARLSHLRGEDLDELQSLRKYIRGVWFDDYYGDLLGGRAEATISDWDIPLFYVSPELHRDTHVLGKSGYQAAWKHVLGNTSFTAICTDFPEEFQRHLEIERAGAS